MLHNQRIAQFLCNSIEMAKPFSEFIKYLLFYAGNRFIGTCFPEHIQGVASVNSANELMCLQILNKRSFVLVKKWQGLKYLTAIYLQSPICFHDTDEHPSATIFWIPSNYYRISSNHAVCLKLNSSKQSFFVSCGSFCDASLYQFIVLMASSRYLPSHQADEYGPKRRCPIGQASNINFQGQAIRKKEDCQRLNNANHPKCCDFDPHPRNVGNSGASLAEKGKTGAHAPPCGVNVVRGILA